MPDRMNDHGPAFRPADAPPGAHRPGGPGSAFREADGVVDVATERPAKKPSRTRKVPSGKKE